MFVCFKFILPLFKLASTIKSAASITVESIRGAVNVKNVANDGYIVYYACIATVVPAGGTPLDSIH